MKSIISDILAFAMVCGLHLMADASDCKSAVADTLAVDSGHEFGEVTVTARRSPTEARASMPVQSLGVERIADLGIQNMADAVRRFAGANVRDYGGIGGLKTVSVRNMGAAHTAVSYDGAPVSNCQGGQIDIGRFSLDNVGSVSLAVGSDGSDMLQPAILVASAAVLSIRSLTPVFRSGRNSSFDVKTKFGSFGYVNPMAAWCTKWGDSGITTSAIADYMHIDGNYPFTLVNGRTTTRERRHNSEVNSWHGEANIDWRLPGKMGTLKAKGYYYYSRRGLPGPVTLYNPVSTELLYDKNAFAQVSYRRAYGNRWRIAVLGKYSYGWNRDRQTGKEFAGGLLQDLHTQREYYMSVATAFTATQRLSLSLAQDGAVNTLRNTIADCPFPTRYTSVTALSGKWRPADPLTVDATGVLTYVTEHVKKGSPPPDRSNFSPSLSLSYRPFRRHAFYLRAMSKSTYRVPAFNDLYYERMGNRSLRPERAVQYGVGVTWNRYFLSSVDYITITADAYHNRVTDKIVAFPTTFAWHMVNYGKVAVKGVDLTLAAAVTPVRGYTIDVSASYTWQRAIDVTDSSAKNYRHQLPYTPEHSGSAGAVLSAPWFTAGYSLVGVGRRYFLSQNVRENEIKGYVEQTLTLGREFKLPGGTTIGGRVELVNFTNEQYDVIKYYPMPGRSFRVTADVKF